MLLLAVKLYFIIGELAVLGVLYVPSVRREMAAEPIPSAVLTMLVIGLFWPISAAVACIGVIDGLMRGE